MVIFATGRDAEVEKACAARMGRRLEGRASRGERRRWKGGIVVIRFTELGKLVVSLGEDSDSDEDGDGEKSEGGGCRERRWFRDLKLCDKMKGLILIRLSSDLKYQIAFPLMLCTLPKTLKSTI